MTNKLKFTPATIPLKDGTPILIRECLPNEAIALMEMVKQYIADSEHLLITPKEFNFSVDYETNWINSLNERSNSLLLVAEHEGQLVGNIDLTGGQRTRIQHTALLGMGMLAAYRGKGLGKALMQCAIDWARQNPVLEYLWLQVYASHSAGLALYQQMGFQETGRQHKFVKKAPGVYEDNVLMELRIAD